MAAAKDDMLEVLGESRAMDKKIATNLEGRYDSPGANKNQSGMHLKTGGDVRSNNPAEAQFKNAAEARRVSQNIQQNGSGLFENKNFGPTNPAVGSKGRLPTEGQFNTMTWENEQSVQYEDESSMPQYRGRGGVEGRPNKPDDWSHNQNSSGVTNKNARGNKEFFNGSQSKEVSKSNKPVDQNAEPLTDAGTFNSPELMQLILREDKMLRGDLNNSIAESAADFIPSEFNGETSDVKEKLSVRVSEGKLTMQARLSQSPLRKDPRASDWNEQTSPQRQQGKSNVQETNKNSRQPGIGVNPSEQKLRSQNDLSNISYTSQQRGRDMNRSVADDNSELIDAWPSMKYRELPRPTDDSGDDDDDDENFCGICVSRRKKKKKSKKN